MAVVLVIGAVVVVASSEYTPFVTVVVMVPTFHLSNHLKLTAAAVAEVTAVE